MSVFTQLLCLMFIGLFKELESNSRLPNPQFYGSLCTLFFVETKTGADTGEGERQDLRSPPLRFQNSFSIALRGKKT